MASSTSEFDPFRTFNVGAARCRDPSVNLAFVSSGVPALACFDPYSLAWDLAVACRDKPEQYAISEPAFPERNMRTLVTGTVALSVLLAAGGICRAQVVAKQEPGQLMTGATVYVDDGTCGKGNIKLITATGGNGNELKGLPQRTRTCVPRQGALR